MTLILTRVNYTSFAQYDNTHTHRGVKYISHMTKSSSLFEVFQDFLSKINLYQKIEESEEALAKGVVCSY